MATLSWVLLACDGGDPPVKREAEATEARGSDDPETAIDGHDAAAEVAGPEAPVEPAPPREGELRALTYNVQGLPEAVTNKDPALQMAGIAPLLGAFQLVGLQEHFMEAPHEALIAAIPHALQAWFSDLVGDDRIFGSGLAVLADREALDVDAVHYDECNGRFDQANDCLASKGFQRVRLRLSAAVGATVDVYNTHLDAGGSVGDQAARAAQVAQLVESLTTWSAGRAAVLLGDLNLRANDPADVPALAALLDGGGLVDACEAVGCPEPNHIDRVLVRGGGAIRLEPLAWRREEQFVDDHGEPLSDHPAISATLRWSLE